MYNSKLKARREAAGLSQSQLATKAGVNIRTLQAYECGLRDINGMAVSSALALADALGCNVRELLQPAEKGEEA